MYGTLWTRCTGHDFLNFTMAVFWHLCWLCIHAAYSLWDFVTWLIGRAAPTIVIALIRSTFWAEIRSTTSGKDARNESLLAWFCNNFLTNNLPTVINWHNLIDLRGSLDILFTLSRRQHCAVPLVAIPRNSRVKSQQAAWLSWEWKDVIVLYFQDISLIWAF